MPSAVPSDGPWRLYASWHGKKCSSAGKRPLVKGFTNFKDHPPSVDQLFAWACEFGPLNLGGVIRTGFVVVEADSPEADQELVAIMPELAHRSPCRAPRPGRGRAWILTAPRDELLTNKAGLGVSGKIDVRGPGGILVIPPSLHRTGHQVTWNEGRSITEVAPVPVNDALLELIKPTPRPKPRPRPGSRALALPRAEGAPEPSHQSPKVQVPSRVKHFLSGYLEFRKLWQGKGKLHGDTSESGYDFAIAYWLLQHRVPPVEVMQALLARPGKRERGHEYIRRTVAKAMVKGRRRK